MELIERVARALCGARNSDPDRIVPGQKISFRGTGGSVLAAKREGEPHALWLHFISDAEAAIEAMEEDT